MLLRYCVLVGVLLQVCCTKAAELEPASSVDFQGDITEPLQLSGVTRHGELLIICPDEGPAFDVLEPASSNIFRVLRSVSLSHDSNDEIDLEGAASDGKSVFLIGSHSAARQQIRTNEDYSTNQSRLLKIKDDKHRDQLFRLTLGEHGKLKNKDSISLRKLLLNDELLSRFTQIPSKENGVDIEGIAVSENRLYLGFRGPVLRGNFVPVMVLQFDSPDEYELRFVDLGGGGIRDLAAVRDGFLLIAGPMGDGPGTYRLCYWNGKDCIPGKDSPGGKVRVLGDIPTQHGAKAEGLAMLAEDQNEWTLLVLYDGAKRGGAQSFIVKKP